MLGSQSVRLSVTNAAKNQLLVEVRELSEPDATEKFATGGHGAGAEQEDGEYHSEDNEDQEALAAATPLPFVQLDDYHDAVKASQDAAACMDLKACFAHCSLLAMDAQFLLGLRTSRSELFRLRTSRSELFLESTRTVAPAPTNAGDDDMGDNGATAAPRTVTVEHQVTKPALQVSHINALRTRISRA